MTGEQITIFVLLGELMVLPIWGRWRYHVVIVTIEGHIRVPGGEAGRADRTPAGRTFAPSGSHNESGLRFDARDTR